MEAKCQTKVMYPYHFQLSMPRRRDNDLKIIMVGPTIEKFERNFSLVKVQPCVNHGTMIRSSRRMKESFSIWEGI